MIDTPVLEHIEEHPPKTRRQRRPIAHVEHTSLRESGANFSMRISKEDYGRLIELADYMGFGTNKTACFRKLLHDKCREVGIMPIPGRKKAFDLEQEEERTTPL